MMANRLTDTEKNKQYRIVQYRTLGQEMNAHTGLERKDSSHCNTTYGVVGQLIEQHFAVRVGSSKHRSVWRVLEACDCTVVLQCLLLMQHVSSQRIHVNFIVLQVSTFPSGFNSIFSMTRLPYIASLQHLWFS